MKLIKHILLATDFSKSSSAATETALVLAKKFDAEMTSIYVVPEELKASMNDTELQKAAETSFRKQVESLDVHDTKIAKIVLAVGVPFDKIIEQAELINANLIVMGTGSPVNSGSSGLGITASRIVRHATKPVWIVKSGCSSSVRKILCPVDMSEPSGRALKNAMHLCRVFKAELTVLNVIKTQRQFYESLGLTPDGEREQEQIDNRDSELESFLKEFDFHGITWNKSIIEGDPKKLIPELAQKDGFDLVAIGATGRGRISRLLIGSVVEALTKNPPCSIFTVKAEDALRLHLEEDLYDLKTAHERGESLLENGFAREAIVELKKSVAMDRFYTPAWDTLSRAYDRIGDNDKTKNSREMFRTINESLWKKIVQAEASKRRNEDMKL